MNLCSPICAFIYLLYTYLWLPKCSCAYVYIVYTYIILYWLMLWQDMTQEILQWHVYTWTYTYMYLYLNVLILVCTCLCSCVYLCVPMCILFTYMYLYLYVSVLSDAVAWHGTRDSITVTESMETFILPEDIGVKLLHIGIPNAHWLLISSFTLHDTKYAGNILHRAFNYMYIFYFSERRFKKIVIHLKLNSIQLFCIKETNFLYTDDF